DLAQLAREPIPAPIRMGRQQSPHLRQLRRANLPPLNDQTVIHTLTLHLPPSRVQPKMKLFSACLPASCPSSFLPVKRKDLNSYLLSFDTSGKMYRHPASPPLDSRGLGNGSRTI